MSSKSTADGGDRDATFVIDGYGDGDGDTLHPAIEASCRMAEDLLNQMAGDGGDNDAGMSRRFTDDDLNEHAFVGQICHHVPREVLQRELADRSLRFLDDAGGGTASGEGGSSPVTGGAAAPGDAVNSSARHHRSVWQDAVADDDGEDDDEKNVGMGGDNSDGGACGENNGFTRANSDQGSVGEWVLERLMKRRTRTTSREEGGSTAGNSPRSSGGGNYVWEYLCKWKWYVEPTWEPRGWLEDEGYGPKLTAFDAEWEARGRSEGRPKDTVVTESHQVQRAALERAFDALFPDIAKTIADIYYKTGYPALQYDFVAPIGPAHRVLNHLMKRSSAKPMLLFHGTRAPCVRNILRLGLIVPGTHGVRILNGSVHGVGIYTATSPSVSYGYTCERGFMFICVGAVDPSDPRVTRPRDDYCVFQSAGLVTPVWLVHFCITGVRPPEATLPKRAPFSVEQFPLFTPQKEPSLDYRPPRPGVPPVPNPVYVKEFLRETGSSPVVTKKMLKRMPRQLKKLVVTRAKGTDEAAAS